MSQNEQRVPVIGPNEINEEQKQAFLEGLPPGGETFFFPEETRRLPWPTSVGTLINHPLLAGKWLSFSTALMHEGLISNRERELMVLRVGWRTRSEYEWLQHVRMARRYKIEMSEVEAVSRGDYDGFAEHERDLLTATDEMIDAYRITEDTWKRLESRYDTKQLMEIAFTIGSYTALAMVFGALGVQIEDDFRELDCPRWDR